LRIEVCDPDRGWTLTRSLEADVYPPAVMAKAPWRDVVWSHADRRVIVWADDEPEPVAHAGLYFRDGLGDGRPLRFGGLGGVMTRTGRQGEGFASAALDAAQAVLREERVDLGLLFCESRLFPFYGRLGWRAFEGAVLIDQPSGRQRFTVVHAMTLGLAARAPLREIDTCGLPW